MVKAQLKCKNRFMLCTGKLLWLIECVKSGLQSILVVLTFWPNNSLLWGCLMHWKMFSSTPGLSPLAANSGRLRHTQNIQINKVICENEKCVFYGKNLNELFGQPNRKMEEQVGKPGLWFHTRCSSWCTLLCGGSRGCVLPDSPQGHQQCPQGQGFLSLALQCRSAPFLLWESRPWEILVLLFRRSEKWLAWASLGQLGVPCIWGMRLCEEGLDDLVKI